MATTTVTQSVANVGPGSLAYELAKELNTSRNCVLKDPGLRIVGGSASALAEAQNAIYAIAAGVIVTKAAGQDMPALVGTVTADEFGLYLWTISSAGTITQATLATGATLAAIVLPEIPVGDAVIGAVLVNPTGTGNFVGGTTVLDDGTVVPNAVFFDGNDIGGALGNRISFRAAGVPE